MQRSIFYTSMAYESDIRPTQHITTSNNYLNYIYILSPTECARRVFNAENRRYFREIIFLTQKCKYEFPTTLRHMNLTHVLHNISQQVITISTISTSYRRLKVLVGCSAPKIEYNFEEITYLPQKCSDQFSTPLRRMNLTYVLHNISQQVITISTISTSYHRLKVLVGCSAPKIAFNF